MSIKEFKVQKLILLLALMLMAGADLQAQSNDSLRLAKDSSFKARDTIFKSGLLDSMMKHRGSAVATSDKLQTQLDLSRITSQPYMSVQQMLKGNIAGLYVAEPSGEPGTSALMYIRGLVFPQLSTKDVYRGQPAIFIDGIPMTQKTPLSNAVQHYDFESIGTNTDVLNIFNSNNIASIEVLKDPAALAALGPLAANGAIWITTKKAHSGKRVISANVYYGLATPPKVTPINAAWENDFRQPFYDKYATTDEKLNYPTFLKDSSDLNYYGPANWVDAYYQAKPIRSVDLSLTGGSKRANFRFMLNNAHAAGVGDGTSLDRYGINFSINMAPLKWFAVSAMINANRLERNSNRSIRGRIAETGYIPDLSNPLPPNKAVYEGVYLHYFDAAIDDNKTNAVQGYVSGAATLGKLTLSSRVAFDYNEGIRDIFWPSTLMESNNYLSNYFSYNQRFMIENKAAYTFDLNNNDQIIVDAGQSFIKDRNKYDYIYGYNTPNDFIKINKIDPNNPKYTGLSPYMFRYTDKEVFILSSLYGRVRYKTLKDGLTLSAMIRNDGSSTYPANNRWMLSPIFSAQYDLKNQLLKSSGFFSSLSINASWGRFGRILNEDRFANGPQYVVDMGWSSESSIGSYRGMAGISRPYSAGWVGYDVSWGYSDKTTLGINAGWWNDRILLSIDLYNNEDKNQLFPMPAPASSGYDNLYENGLWVNNKGVDVALSAHILKHDNGLNWLFNANVNYNKNTLSALPGGKNEVVIGDRKFVVGKSIDQFWVYQNDGIYNSASEVPISSVTNAPLSFNGIPFSAGDAIWKDNNNDGVVNNDDKTLKGHYLPTVSGGFGSRFTYKGFNLDFQFYYALGRSVLNRYLSSRYDFINVESANDINSVKEITFWEKHFSPSDLPLYNPWSDVEPYRVDQDLFLQNASYLKLRSLSVGYDLSSINGLKKAGFSQALIYLSATNLFTITPFKTGDPEQSTYNGIYNGYGMPLPKNYTIGVKLTL